MKISATARTKPLGSAITIEGTCDNTPIIFNDVICNIEIIFKLTSCDNLFATISDLILDKMEIVFGSVNIYCDIALQFLGQTIFSLSNLDIGSNLSSIIRSKTPDIKKALAPLFNNQFKNINIPSLPCIRLSSGCLLGVDIKGKDLYREPILKNLTWNECVDLCNNTANCNYIYHSVGNGNGGNNRGICNFYNIIGTIYTSTSGSYYNKNTKEIKRGIPLLGQKTALFEGKTNEFNNLECSNICRSNPDCVGFTFENNICSLYKTAGNQNVTLRLDQCERNIKTPTLFQ